MLIKTFSHWLFLKKLHHRYLIGFLVRLFFLQRISNDWFFQIFFKPFCIALKNVMGVSLTHFMPLISFCTSWKHYKTKVILIFFFFFWWVEIDHTARKKSVFGVFLAFIFRIWTEYGPEKLPIRTLFMQCQWHKKGSNFKICRSFVFYFMLVTAMGGDK